MKKRIALFLAAMMVLGILAGCGDQRPGGDVTPLPSTDESSKVADKEVSLGAMEGGTYTNDYVGFGCKLDGNWTFATAEQLQKLPANVKDLLADSELGDSISSLAQFFDMQAENVTDLTSVNVVYQKLDMKTRLAYAVMTEEQILDETLKQKDAMISSYATAGITVSTIEKVKVNFLGQERYALLTTSTVEDVPYFTLQLFEFKLGAYSVTTTFASYIENNTQALLDLFYAI